MTDIGVMSGQRLYLEWALPIDVPPAEQVVLGINGATLDFVHNDEIIESFTSQDDELMLVHSNGQWSYRFICDSLDWLPASEKVQYEFLVLDMVNEEMVSDKGSVTLHV